MNSLKFYSKSILGILKKSFLIDNPFLGLFTIFIFALPLISSSNTNELYEFPKMYFVYFFGTAIIAYFAVRQIWLGDKFPRVPMYIKLYLISFVISSYFSIHFYTSFWGYYTRFNDSLMSTFIFFGLYMVARAKFTQENYLTLFRVMLFSSIPISLIAISQHSTEIRVYSTFGQANWLAQFFAMVLPFAHYLYFVDESILLWLAISVLGFAGLWFTYSLSGILGYGIGFTTLLFLFRKKLFSKFENRANVYKLLFLLLVCEMIAVTNLGVFRLRVIDSFNDVKKFVSTSLSLVYAQDTAPLSNPVSGNANIQRNLSDPGYIRGGMWLGTSKLIFSSPKIALIGTGPETFPYAFQFFRPKQLNYSSEWNFVFNKPHNYYLEIASEQGLIGLAIYIYLCYMLIKKLPRKYLPMFLAFMVTNIFGWPTVYTTFIFWLMLASIEERTINE